MTTAVSYQRVVTIPAFDLGFFDDLAKIRKWVSTPSKAIKTTKGRKMTMAEMRALAEELDRINNPLRLKATPEEIDEIIRECRNGK
ncbi:MAG: hypothetical protein FWC39_05430 [Bacteroidetes bacterium]|nr:hypothetical protein [Bacteroidota bacterium]